MIIKKVIIENYMCYYGRKIFEFTEGLNVILGENGEGKTKFFEALDWLLTGNTDNQLSLASKKALQELEDEDSITVGVTLTAQQNDSENTISRSFKIKKGKDDNIIYNDSITGKVYDSTTGERDDVNGIELIEIIFPHRIRKYSMFKGESAINIFKENKTLQELIEINSHAKYYEPYVDIITDLKNEAERIVSKESSKHARDSKAYDSLRRDLERLKSDLFTQKRLLTFSEGEIEKTNEELRAIKNDISNAEELKIVNERINKIQAKKKRKNSFIDEDYTTKLFDEKWLLLHFSKIHKEYSEKITLLNKERRSKEREYIKQMGIKEGEKKASIKLLKDVIALPIGTPSKAYMEEMLEEEICKVCNREVEKGSEAYKFMEQRLQEYLNEYSKSPQESKKEKPLFPHNYIKELVYRNQRQEEEIPEIETIRQKIIENIDFTNRIKNDIKELNEKLEKEEEDRRRILNNSNRKDYELIDNLKNYTTWQESLMKNKELKIDYKSKIEKLSQEIEVKEKKKESIDLKSVSKFYTDTNNILGEIKTIFKDTKEHKFDEFIQKLENKSNEVFRQINAFAFTGIIKFNKSISNKIKIQLQEDNGEPFFNPNQSLETSMYISIIFAISDLTKEARDESFPLIFDAPTSSFGETKKAEFLDLIYNTSGQKILLIKDFLIKNEDNNLTIKKEFDNIKRNKAMWVRLERPFNSEKLETINSQIISI